MINPGGSQSTFADFKKQNMEHFKNSLKTPDPRVPSTPPAPGREGKGPRGRAIVWGAGRRGVLEVRSLKPERFSDEL